MVAFVKPLTGWRPTPSKARMAYGCFGRLRKDLLLTDHALAFYGHRAQRLSNEEERRLLIRRVISWTLVGLIHVLLLSLIILDQIRERRQIERHEPVVFFLVFFFLLFHQRGRRAKKRANQAETAKNARNKRTTNDNSS